MKLNISLPQPKATYDPRQWQDIIRQVEVALARVVLVSPAYGEMHLHSGSQAVVISASSTWTKVGAGMTGGVQSRILFQNASELAVSEKGVYQAVWGIYLDAAGPNDEIEGGVMVNGAIVTKGTAHVKFTAATTTGGFASSLLMELFPGDVVALAVNNNTDADDVTVEHASLVLTKVSH